MTTTPTADNHKADHRVTKTHLYFWGGPFSNWYPAPITLNGAGYMTSEHLFMWMKATHFHDSAIAQQITECTHPGSAKQLGRQIKGFDDAEWAKVRYGAMVNCLIAKFDQNPTLCHTLIDTDELVLVEASPMDKVWGVGLDKDNDLILDETNWLGENLLGKALMEVRNTFKFTHAINNAK